MIEASGVEERHVTPPRGVVSISATYAVTDAFVVRPWHAENPRHGSMRQAVRHLASLVETRLRRAA
ncbi:hypothetical protein ACTJLC_00270 [Paraburkholderia sp. 22099]|jgi:hypothetical protein|uniref:hypothetical protein n=1 Tax=Paraburkholderia sp. 22099 TaxID=3453875 RepID=UPI003F862A3B